MGTYAKRTHGYKKTWTTHQTQVQKLLIGPQQERMDLKPKKQTGIFIMGWECLRIVQWKFQNTNELKCDFVSGEPIQPAEPADNGVFPLQISAAVNAELGYLSIRMLPYSPLVLIRWGSSQVQFFSFLQCSNLIGPSLNKIETMESPQNKRLYFEV
jgi:hypothetical protein